MKWIAWLSVLLPLSRGETAFSTNYLFNEDEFVTELRKPVDLLQFIASLKNDTQPYCQRSRIILLYSGHCPHCHAFRPTWSAFGKGIHCAQANLGVGAFECIGKDRDRSNTLEELNVIQNNTLKITDENEDQHITPREVCSHLKDQYYPTLLLAIRNSCRLKSPFKKFATFDSKIDLYHIPVDSQSTNVASLNEMLLKQKMVPKCAEFRSSKEMDSRIKEWLRGYEATPRDQRQRWDDRAIQLAPDYRIHDAALGLFHIMDAWILSEKLHPSKDEVVVIDNFVQLARATALDDSLSSQLTELLQFIRQRGEELTSAEWQIQIKNLNVYGLTMESLESDPLKHSLTCSHPSCLAWTFFHVAAESNMLKINRDFHSGVNTPYVDIAARHDVGEVHEETASQALDGRIRPGDFVLIFRDLVNYFFDCMSCRNHFMVAYDHCVADGCRWPTLGVNQTILEKHPQSVLEAAGLVLYLWRFHNTVTVRTATSHTLDRLRIDFNEDPSGNHTRLSYLETNVRLPSEELCERVDVACKKYEANDSLITKSRVIEMMEAGDDESQLSFDYYEDYNLTAVLVFLRRFYIPDDIAKGIGAIKTLTWIQDKRSMKVDLATGRTAVPDQIKKGTTQIQRKEAIGNY